MGCCVFHDDRDPSMWVDTVNDTCGCFVPGCPAHDRCQDAINVFSRVSGLSNSEAIFEMARMLGIE